MAGTETPYRAFNRLHSDLLIVSKPKGWEGVVAVYEDAQHQLTKLTRGQGARRERLRPEMLLSMMVNMPSIIAQRKTNDIIRKLRQIRTMKEPYLRDADALGHALIKWIPESAVL